jgi:hypothetical protein
MLERLGFTEVFRAATEAAKAADFVLGSSRESVETTEEVRA